MRFKPVTLGQTRSVPSNLRSQKPPHFPNYVTLSVDEAVVVCVGQLDHSAIWNLFAKVFELLLHIYCLQLLRNSSTLSRFGSGSALTKSKTLEVNPTTAKQGTGALILA